MINRGQMARQIANARASRGGMNRIQPPPRMAAPNQAVSSDTAFVNDMYDSFMAQQPQMSTVTPVAAGVPGTTTPAPMGGAATDAMAGPSGKGGATTTQQINSMAKGGKVKKMAKGGSVKGSSGMAKKSGAGRGDGICMKGHTKGKMY